MMNKTGTQRLETHRLVLRRCRAEDAEEMYNNWVKVWGFFFLLIKEAYDRCINSIGKYRASYVNSILLRWHQSGIKTLEQAKADEKPKQKKQKPTDSDTGNSSFDIDELDSLAMFDD